MPLSSVARRFDVHDFLVDVIDDLAEVRGNITNLRKVDLKFMVFSVTSGVVTMSSGDVGNRFRFYVYFGKLM